MSRWLAVSLVLPALLLTPPARGEELHQDMSPTEGFVQEEPSLEGRFAINVGASLVIPISDANNRFDVGWGFVVGGAYNFTDMFSVQAEYQYSDFDVKDSALAQEAISGDHVLQYGDLNVIVNLVPRKRWGIYLLGGPGIYYRKVELTQFGGAVVAPVCDPWLLVCFDDVVAVDNVLGSRSSTDFGLNGGVGFTYRVYGPMRVYVEARYHYIFGPRFDTPTGSHRANGQYLPINLGLRF
ncbi:porin family protein [Myxococcus sp. K15C18031901]|uniref:outer membrane beta-barrel protein n=1 Tax=Myxococcus dinghuensis TaxID=2906761 RepID=UPI0020A7775E|nr:outer membrane beta-barrel protein [Myxococcus dinghuensis]MCP3099452.1 porin family protein [Myxococcus dinghuensis]